MQQTSDELDNILSELSNIFGINHPTSSPIQKTSPQIQKSISTTSCRVDENVTTNMYLNESTELVTLDPTVTEEEFFYYQPEYVNVEVIHSAQRLCTSGVNSCSNEKSSTTLDQSTPLSSMSNSITNEDVDKSMEPLYLPMTLSNKVEDSNDDIYLTEPLFQPGLNAQNHKFLYQSTYFPSSDEIYEYEEIGEMNAVYDYVEPDVSPPPNPRLLHKQTSYHEETSPLKQPYEQGAASKFPPTLAERMARLTLELPNPLQSQGARFGSTPSLDALKTSSRAIYKSTDALNEGYKSNETVPRRSAEFARPEKILTHEEKLVFLQEQSRRISEMTNSKKVILRVHHVDDSYKTIVVDYHSGAREVIELLLVKNNWPHSISWQLYEMLPDEGLVREIEDHESVAQIYESWPPNSSNRLVIRENFKKYEIFQNPALYLPGCVERRITDHKKQSTIEHARERLMQEMLMSTDKITELSGHLWIKEGKKKWRRVFCALRKSGLYYSIKGASKVPRHWFLLVNFTDVDFYNCLDVAKLKKLYDPPLPELIVFIRKGFPPQPIKERVCICGLDRPNRICWQQGIRLSKYGVDIIRQNYQVAFKRHQKLKQLVADNESVALKKPINHQISRPADPKRQEPWLREDLSAKAAEDLLLESSAHSGKFLVRSFDGKMYLSILNGYKILHAEIHRVNVNSSWLLSLDNGLRNFRTLKDLIAHHRVENGVLPVKLTAALGE